VNFNLKKIVVCLCLLVVTVDIYAEQPDSGSEYEDVQELSDAERKGAEESVEEDDGYGDEEFGGTEDLDDYHITRREHPENPCERDQDEQRYEKSWYDHTQIYINSRFCEPALWFDNFFATDRLFNEGVAGSYVRWRNDFRYDEEGYFTYEMDLKFSVELPGFKDKLRLTFEGEDDEDLRDIAPGNDDETNNSLALQLDLKQNARSKFNVSVSLSPRIRFRYRYTYPIFQDTILRFTQEAQWKDGVNSARSRFDFEQPFSGNFLFRSSTGAKVSEEYDGVDWLQGLVVYQRINKKSSLAYEASAEGITEPVSATINYRLGVRFRKNFHREWLFYEIVPEVTWPITFDSERLMIQTERRSKWGLFFRLEVHFGNAYRKRYQDYN
jgi:hypothetical protein